MMIALEHYFLWFLFYSFVGWVYESILVSCQERRLVNRGFLNGPLCPIYGTGAVLGIAVLGNLHNPIIIFLISMVGATILEYTTSWVMEELFHARWWDYSNFRFNVQGRVCLLGAVIFGIAGVVIVLGAQPYVAQFTDLIPVPMLHTLVTVLALVTIIDLAVTVAGMLEFEQVLDSVTQTVQDVAARACDTWQWGSSAVSDKMRELSQDTIERLRWAANGVINAQQKRMLKSFPKFQVPDRQDIIDSLRELMGPRR
ncbi:MAG: putative ABC transporter permease [Bifidobacterium breve]|nr:putative ABC transporter permease [Bifidobacterium breve]